MDQSIGRVLQHLRQIGEYDNTLIVFMSDNGPSKTAILDYLALGGKAAEFFEQFDNRLENRGRPGSSTDIGPGWAYASATPLRLFKGYVAQGGIRVPLIVKPAGAFRTGAARRHTCPRDGPGADISGAGWCSPAGTVARRRGCSHPGPIAGDSSRGRQ